MPERLLSSLRACATGGHRVFVVVVVVVVFVLVVVLVLAGGSRRVAGAATHPYVNMGSHGIPWDPM